MKNSHERGADWYKDIIKNAGKAEKGLVGKERDEAINKVLTEAIVKLEQTIFFICAVVVFNKFWLPVVEVPKINVFCLSMKLKI